MYRKELSRIYELRDLLPGALPANAYFQNLDETLAGSPSKLRQFRELENLLQCLDLPAWHFLKSEANRLLCTKDFARGWPALFDKLNQARAYKYLKDRGCTDIKFIEPSPARGQKTPDLSASLDSELVLCEVKTINISNLEANRRRNGGVIDIQVQLEQGFFSKLESDLDRARKQISSYAGDDPARKMVYFIVNFDDLLHEYADRYRTQVDQFMHDHPVTDMEVFFDIKPPFYSALI